MAVFSKRSLGNLEGIHPDLVKVMKAAIVDTPVDFTIVEGVRTLARQKQLYAQGRTAPGRIVTNADGVRHKSNHQAKADGWGHAVDLYPYIDGGVRVTGIHAELRRIAAHIKDVAARLGIPIEWGGDWKTFHDAPHFELK